jgi:hypothetical protein
LSRRQLHEKSKMERHAALGSRSASGVYLGNIKTWNNIDLEPTWAARGTQQANISTRLTQLVSLAPRVTHWIYESMLFFEGPYSRNTRASQWTAGEKPSLHISCSIRVMTRNSRPLSLAQRDAGASARAWLGSTRSQDGGEARRAGTRLFVRASRRCLSGSECQAEWCLV